MFRRRAGTGFSLGHVMMAHDELADGDVSRSGRQRADVSGLGAEEPHPVPDERCGSPGAPGQAWFA